MIYKESLKRVNELSVFLKLPLFFLIISGLLSSSYLLYRHNILSNNATGKIDICSAVFGKGCDTALMSSVSTQMGLPLAAWGIIFYSLIMVLLLFPAFLGKSYKADTSLPVYALSLSGAIGSLTLLGMMLFNHSLFCPVCVVIHCINLFLFLIISLKTGYILPVFFKQLWKETISLFNFRSFKKDTLIKWFGIGTFMVLAFCIYTALQIFSKNDTAVKPMEIINRYEKNTKQNIPVDSDDPILGSEKFPVQIIVFSDFECPYCRYFANVINELNKKFNNEFYVVFKYFPLDNSCNPDITKEIHPNACEAAVAAEAARQQGKFWQYHDLLFASDFSKSTEVFKNLATQLKLDSSKFEDARTGGNAQNKVAETINEGIKLKIHGTPTVFLNGRMVDNFRLQPMEILLNHILKDKSLLPGK